MNTAKNIYKLYNCTNEFELDLAAKKEAVASWNGKRDLIYYKFSDGSILIICESDVDAFDSEWDAIMNLDENFGIC